MIGLRTGSWAASRTFMPAPTTALLHPPPSSPCLPARQPSHPLPAPTCHPLPPAPAPGLRMTASFAEEGRPCVFQGALLSISLSCFFPCLPGVRMKASFAEEGQPGSSGFFGRLACGGMPRVKEGCAAGWAGVPFE